MAGDRLDPRVLLVAPEAIQADLDGVLAWALEHAPNGVLDDQAAHANAGRRASRSAWRQLSVEEKAHALRAFRARSGDASGIPPRECWPRDPRQTN